MKRRLTQRPLAHRSTGASRREWFRFTGLSVFILLLWSGMPAHAYTDMLKHSYSLLDAVDANDVDAVRQFMLRRTSPDRADDAGRTPLSVAAGNGNVDIVKLLLDNGARPSLKDASAKTPLHLAAVNNQDLTAALLLDRGAVIDAQDSQGITPLMLAAGKGNLEVIKVILAHHPDPGKHDFTGRTALDWAVQAKQTGAARLLRGPGAS
ncbi:MAG TPA: ankyrin repeat domain-containing protein [Stellaceae bacterium]|nr:ankyrin repeat domain-containing protein [Stellaceae bacterium]